MIGSNGLRQGEIKQDGIGQGQAAGEQKRHVDSPAAHHAADRRSEDEAESESCANQSHALRAIFFGGYVSDVRLSGGYVAAGNSVNDSADEEHPQSRGKSQ